jgi:hypothetical protein
MTTQAQGAKQLVQRARAGDQNAMAMIAQVGSNARAGNQTARSAFSLIKQYISENPVQMTNSMGAEVQEALGVLKEPSNHDHIGEIWEILCKLPIIGDGPLIQTACVILGNGPQWTKGKIKAVDNSLVGAEQNLFRFGYDNSMDPKRIRPIAQKLSKESVGPLCAGHCIGTARRIQLARMPQVPVSVLSPEIGWELGC